MAQPLLHPRPGAMFNYILEGNFLFNWFCRCLSGPLVTVEYSTIPRLLIPFIQVFIETVELFLLGHVVVYDPCRLLLPAFFAVLFYGLH